MSAVSNIFLINQFPDFSVPGFDTERYNRIFVEHNVIINARARHIEYDEHWGPLSVKCAFGGREYYRAGGRTVAVDDDRFLVFNHGKQYSSYIRSESVVQSFTINFNPAFVAETLSALQQRDPDGTPQGADGLRFSEQLYPHDPTITPLLLRLRSLSLALQANRGRISEIFAEVLEQLIVMQQEVRCRIDRMSPVRPAAKQELYLRLQRAKDLIDSCYMHDLTLESIAGAASLAPVYALREFKRNFHLTPHQYLTQQRIEAAKRQLVFGDGSITDVCLAVGYSDLSSFSKLFKARTGFSPERYRSLARS